MYMYVSLLSSFTETNTSRHASHPTSIIRPLTACASIRPHQQQRAYATVRDVRVLGCECCACGRAGTWSSRRYVEI
eukprot:1887089-Prymnesium_polylepis.1